MIISSGQMKVLKNGNRKVVKFFGEVEQGDVIEVRVELNSAIRYGASNIVTAHNLTKDTSRTDAPTYINSGLEKMALEPVKLQDDTEYQRGYQDAVGELQSAYIGGYIGEYFEDEEED